MTSEEKWAYTIFAVLFGISIFILLREVIIDKFLKNWRLVETQRNGEGVVWSIEQRRRRSGWKKIHKSSDYGLMKETFEVITSPPNGKAIDVVIAEYQEPIKVNHGRKQNQEKQSAKEKG